MPTYEITYSDGRPAEQYGDYEMAAERILESYPYGIVGGHSGDLLDGGDRSLAWADEEDARNDDGQRAVATIRIAGTSQHYAT